MQIKNLSVTMKHFKFLTFSVTLLTVFLLSDCGGGTTPPPPTLSFDFLTEPLKSCAQATGATSISQVTELDCSGRVISVLTGIDQLTSLIKLNLNNNNIDNDGILILANMTWLTELYLSSNLITDIGALTNLNGLTDLTLSGNTIADFNQLLTILGDIHLVNLNLGSVGDLSDASGNFAPLITTLTDMFATLRSLRLDNNQIDVIPVSFSGLNFLTGLTLDNNDISDITNLQDLDSLVSLHLFNNPITNISPLTDFPAAPPLTELTLAGGDIGGVSNFNPLSDFPDLTALRLKNTGFDDADMTNIETLLPNLVNMTTIDLTGGGNGTITDTSLLAGGLALTELVLSNNPGIGAHADNFNALVSLDNLITLHLNNTGFDSTHFGDLTTVQTIANLTELNLSTNTIGTGFFGSLNDMTSLVTLKLNSTGFADADFSALPNVLPNLTSLSLDSNNIVDVRPFAALTNLTTLSLDTNLIDKSVAPNIYSLSALTHADSIDLSNNIGMSCSELTALINDFSLGVVTPDSAISSGGSQNCTAP